MAAPPHGGAAIQRSRTSPLDVADAAFRAAVAGPPPLVLDGVAAGHGLPPRDVPLDELKRILLAPPTAYAGRDAAVAALLRRTRSGDERWILGLTGVLLPGLRRMAGRLTRSYPGDPDCIDAEVLAGFIDGVVAWDGRARTGIASRLLWAAYRRGRQLWAQEITAAAHRAQGEVPATATRRADHPDLVLARAASAGVITAAEAELIAATRLERVRVRDLAARDGVAVGALRRRRERAEARLVAYLRSGDPRMSRFATNRGLVSCGPPRGGATGIGGQTDSRHPCTSPPDTDEGGDSAPCRPVVLAPGSRSAA